MRPKDEVISHNDHCFPAVLIQVSCKGWRAITAQRDSARGKERRVADCQNQCGVIGLLLGDNVGSREDGHRDIEKGWDVRGWGPLVWEAASGGK